MLLLKKKTKNNCAFFLQEPMAPYLITLFCLELWLEGQALLCPLPRLSAHWIGTSLPATEAKQDATELGRVPGELNRIAESDCSEEPVRRVEEHQPRKEWTRHLLLEKHSSHYPFHRFQSTSKAGSRLSPDEGAASLFCGKLDSAASLWTQTTAELVWLPQADTFCDEQTKHGTSAACRWNQPSNQDILL